MSMHQVVSFSGGRTSAYLVHLMEAQRKAGASVHFIFMDTGCEHPLTYRFIREVVKFWNVPLTVLQVDINPELGQPNGYTEWEPKDIQTRMPVLKPFMDMVKKYGTPYIGGAFCTDRLKLTPFTKYCDDHFGRGNYITWLGIRADEPRRLKPKPGVRYLAELSDFDKSDVIRWWRKQPFDLQIPEHLGNCVFCIKKSTQKLGLACKDEPGLMRVFNELVTGKHVRDGHRRTGSWISCSERMPAQDDWILIYSKHGEYMAGQVQGEYVELSDGTLSWLGNALFWMPLPEPPQEVNQ